LISWGTGRDGAGAAAGLEAVVVGDDVVADLDTLVADEDGRARDQLADVVLILVAERAAEDLALTDFFVVLSLLASTHTARLTCDSEGRWTYARR
jgi:hypothetical protein